jgi:hypothetical protein
MITEAMVVDRAGINKFPGLPPKFDVFRRSAQGRKSGMNSPRSASCYKVVIGYQNLEAGERALRMLDGLVGSFNPLDELDVTVWHFDRLSDPESLDRALAEANEADLIVFSSNRPKSAPSAGETWLKLSLDSKTRQANSVVVLFRREEIWTFSIQEETSAATVEEYILPSEPFGFEGADGDQLSARIQPYHQRMTTAYASRQ